MCRITESTLCRILLIAIGAFISNCSCLLFLVGSPLFLLFVWIKYEHLTSNDFSWEYYTTHAPHQTEIACLILVAGAILIFLLPIYKRKDSFNYELTLGTGIIWVVSGVVFVLVPHELALLLNRILLFGSIIGWISVIGFCLLDMGIKNKRPNDFWMMLFRIGSIYVIALSLERVTLLFGGSEKSYLFLLDL